MIKRLAFSNSSVCLVNSTTSWSKCQLAAKGVVQLLYLFLSTTPLAFKSNLVIPIADMSELFVIDSSNFCLFYKVTFLVITAHRRALWSPTFHNHYIKDFLYLWQKLKIHQVSSRNSNNAKASLLTLNGFCLEQKSQTPPPFLKKPTQDTFHTMTSHKVSSHTYIHSENLWHQVFYYSPDWAIMTHYSYSDWLYRIGYLLGLCLQRKLKIEVVKMMSRLRHLATAAPEENARFGET